MWLKYIILQVNVQGVALGNVHMSTVNTGLLGNLIKPVIDWSNHCNYRYTGRFTDFSYFFNLTKKANHSVLSSEIWNGYSDYYTQSTSHQ